MGSNGEYPDVASLISLLDSLRNAPLDNESRKRLIEAAKGLQLSLEEPLETCKRLRYSALELTVAQILSNIDLFDILQQKSDSFTTTDELAQLTKTDPVLLRRLLRHAASVCMVEQVADDRWAPSRITKSLALPSSKADIDFAFGNISPHFQDFPRFLAQTNYQNPTDPLHTVHQMTRRTDQSLFAWQKANPDAGERFNKYMASQRNQINWLDVFPFDQAIFTREEDAQFGKYLFVDVGGGFGHVAKALRSRFPDLPGRVALQDLPQTVSNAPQVPGVEIMGHDFFQPQPIAGARAYYLRNILHDWPDEKAQLILKQLANAMDRDSILLLDEKVLPDMGVSTVVAGLDLAMLMFFAAMERSEKQWRELVRGAGLEVKEVRPYSENHDSVLVAKLA